MRVLTGLLACALIVLGCAQDDQVTLLNSFSGYVAVGTVVNGPNTGPGLVTLFDPDGNAVATLADGYSSGTSYPSGIAYLGGGIFAFFMEVAESLDRLNVVTGNTSSFSSSNITANPIRHIAVDAEGSIFIAEGSVNTVEKLTSTNQRVGNPFIATTTGSCALSSPWGIAHDPVNNRIAVISSNGRFSLYNFDGSCNTHTTAAPFNSGTPVAICYHSLSQRFVVVFSGNHAIYSVSPTGTGGTLIYQNSTIINTPRSVACAPDGHIYVGSDGTDTVEKLYYDGTGVATRALGGPFAGPGITTQNPTSIAVIP